jgi:hypothetical protein
VFGALRLRADMMMMITFHERRFDNLQEERRKNLASRGSDFASRGSDRASRVSSSAGKRFRAHELLVIPQTPDRQTSFSSQWLSVDSDREAPPSRGSRISRRERSTSFNIPSVGAHEQQQDEVNQMASRQPAAAHALLASKASVTEETKLGVVQKRETDMDEEPPQLQARKSSVRFHDHDDHDDDGDDDDGMEHTVGENVSSTFACLCTPCLTSWSG